MKIIRLAAANVKALKAVEIEPDGSAVVIGGRNAQGKSSVLDSITYALAGKRAQPSMPVRDGADGAEVVVDLGEIVVTRRIKPGGNSYLAVTGTDGAKVSSPQQLLDKLTGELAFDPLAFARAKPRDQAEQLRVLSGLDFAAVDARRRDLAAERTIADREAKQLRARASAATIYDAPGEPVDIAALLAEIERRQSANAANAAARADVERAGQEVVRRRVEVDGLREQLRVAEERLNAAIADHDGVAAIAICAVDEPTDDLREQLTGAQEVNSRVDANRRAAELGEQADAAEARAGELGRAIAELDEQKRAELAAADMPVNGLTFDADGVSFGGVPLDQCSQAEQIKVSVALGLAINPDIRVLLIREGALLDDDSLAMVARMAEKRDAQVWVERVGEGEECSVVIENGVVK